MSTPQDMPPMATHKPGVSKRTIWMLVATVLVLIVFALGQLIHLPYAIFRPGPAQDTLGKLDKKEIISISGTQTYPTDGRLDFTTVSLYGGPNYPVNVWDWVRAKIDKNSEIVPEESVFPKGVSGKQVEEENTAEMTSSQEAAEVVGVRATGKKVIETVNVGQVAKGKPADGKLKVNDRIDKVNGVATPTLKSIHAEMDKVKAGSQVTIVVNRAGKPATVTVGTAKDPKSGRAVMGIILSPKFAFPFKVQVNAGDVGGPSAGLMFSLAIYDKLTPGPMTGGKEFAGTGTIDTDGNVGPIGGIRQKMVGAHDDGADYFLAPADNCDEVRDHVPDDMTVVKVATFNDAKTAVEKIAKGTTTGLPAC